MKITEGLWTVLLVAGRGKEGSEDRKIKIEAQYNAYYVQCYRSVPASFSEILIRTCNIIKGFPRICIKVKSRIRSEVKGLIRIRIKVKSWIRNEVKGLIRIRIKVKSWIRNEAKGLIRIRMKVKSRDPHQNKKPDPHQSKKPQ